MKNIICLSIAIFLAGATYAQRNAETQSQYRNDISIADQLKGTSIPNVQYRSQQAKINPAASNQKQQGPGAQIKNNAEPGKVYKTTAGSGAAPTAPATASEHALPSDKKATPLKSQPAPEMPKNLTQ